MTRVLAEWKAAKDRWRRAGIAVVHAWGLTAAAAIVTTPGTRR